MYLCLVCKKENDRATNYYFTTFKKKKKRFGEVKNY